jgi:hypothetical protein
VTFVGIVALLVSCIAAAFAFPNRHRDRYLLGFVLLALHLGATVFYYQYVQTHDADAPLYYYDPAGMANGVSAYGTVFLVSLVQTLRHALGGSYFEYFLLFQTFGFVGIIILSRSMSFLQFRTQLPPTRAYVLFLFLPSVQFWTSAIGKDAPLFFACSLAAWATLKFSSRWIWFLLAVAVMMFLRPHIAFIAAAALSLSLFLDNRYESVPRLLFFLAAIASIPFLWKTVGTTLNFDASDPNSMADFIVAQHNIGNVLGGSAVHGGFFVRLFSLMFRPFFIDSRTAIGIIASLENTIFLISMLYCMINYRALYQFFSVPVYSKYCVFFTFILTISLATVYYNVGLGLRERVMAYPTLFPIFAAAWAIRRQNKRLTGVGRGAAEWPIAGRQAPEARPPSPPDLSPLPNRSAPGD